MITVAIPASSTALVLLCTLVVSLVGCVTLSGHTVVIDERADARLG